MRQISYPITEEDNGRQVRIFLKFGQGYSSRMITKLRKIPNAILLNGVPVFTTALLHTGDVLTITLPQEENLATPLAAPLAPLYEDEDLLVFNKPSDMPVHQAKRHQEDTLANVFAHYMQGQGSSARFRPVNRLDRCTSGLVVVAKNQFCAGKLNGHVQKEYLALAGGCIENDEGKIQAPIKRVEGTHILRCVAPGGQYALTEYKCIFKNKYASLLRVWLPTGRTHQIRVHMQYIGHPLIGDELYGGDTSYLNRQALHCQTVCFIHPVSQKPVTVTSALPQDIQTAMQRYGFPCLNV